MIIDAFLNLILNIALFLIDLLPTVELEVASQITDSFITYLCMASYFVPLDTILLILFAQFTIEVLKITIAGLKLFIQFIPFM